MKGELVGAEAGVGDGVEWEVVGVGPEAAAEEGVDK